MVASSGPLIQSKEPKPQMGKLGSSEPKQGKQAEPKKMSEIDIIRKSSEKEMPGVNTDQVIRGLYALIKAHNGRIIRMGDTVFFIKPLGNGSVEFHTFTVEPPEELVKRFKAGVNTLKQMGFNKAISYANQPAFKKLAQDTGLPVKISQSQQMLGGKMVPAYKFELDL